MLPQVIKVEGDSFVQLLASSGRKPVPRNAVKWKKIEALKKPVAIRKIPSLPFLLENCVEQWHMEMTALSSRSLEPQILVRRSQYQLASNIKFEIKPTQIPGGIGITVAEPGFGHPCHIK